MSRPAEYISSHSRVIPKDFAPTGWRRNGEGSMDQVLEYVTTQRDNIPIIPDTQVQLSVILLVLCFIYDQC
jgi:hypothetical protein